MWTIIRTKELRKLKSALRKRDEFLEQITISLSALNNYMTYLESRYNIQEAKVSKLVHRLEKLLKWK